MQMKYVAAFAVTEQEKVVWNSIYSFLPEDGGVELFAGRRITEVLRTYEAAREDPDQFPDRALSPELLADYSPKRKVPYKAKTTLERLERKAMENHANLYVRLDRDSRSLYVSDMSFIQYPMLRLPLDLSEDVVQAIKRTALPIAGGLGTKAERRQRELPDPWDEIANALASEDPVKALEQAAAKDTLRNRIWVESEKQGMRRDTSNSLNFDNIGVNIPGAMDNYYHKVHRSTEAMLCIRNDGTICAPAPSKEPVYLQLPGPYDEKAWVRAMNLADKLERSPDMLLEYRDLCKGIKILGAMKRAQEENCPGAATALGWVLKELVARKGNGKIPGLEFGTWGELLEAARMPMDGKIATPAEMAQEVLVFGINEQESYTEVSANPTTYGNVLASTELALEDGFATLGETTTGQYEIEAKRIERTVRYLQSLYPLLLFNGQRVYFTQADSTKGQIGSVSSDDEDWFLNAGGVQHEITEAVEEKGILVFTSISQAQKWLQEKGRRPIRRSKLSTPMPYMSQAVLDALCNVANWPDVDPLCLETVPMGWQYTLAQFRDGKIGVAYGPEDPDECAPETKERLYREAAEQPSSSALLLL